LPWKESPPVPERERFIDAYMQREDTVAELSRRFGISRKTGYKWIERYMSGLELTTARGARIEARMPHHERMHP
jgi:transposase-like protein